MNKRVAIVDGERVHDAEVAPGTTAGDVLASIGRHGQDYQLTPRSGLPFGRGEAIFGQIADGEKLHASTGATVGA